MFPPEADKLQVKVGGSNPTIIYSKNMSESARKLENYFIQNKAEFDLEHERKESIEIPEDTVKLAVDHMTWILRQNEGRKLMVPFSGGKDSILTSLLACEAHRENPQSITLVHETSSSSPEERRMVKNFQRYYGINVKQIRVDTPSTFADFEPDSWEKVEAQFEARHRAIEAFIESGEYIRVLSGNLTEDLLGLLTPATFTEEDKVLQPITMLFGSEVSKLLRQFNVPRELVLQKPYTSETKQSKEDVLGLSYEIIDAALWLKLHSADVQAIARALGVKDAWLRELLVKRVKNRKDAIYPILKEAQEDPLSMGAIPEELKKHLADYRWARLRSMGVSLSGIPFIEKPTLETFYEGI